MSSIPSVIGLGCSPRSVLLWPIGHISFLVYHGIEITSLFLELAVYTCLVSIHHLFIYLLIKGTQCFFSFRCTIRWLHKFVSYGMLTTAVATICPLQHDHDVTDDIAYAVPCSPVTHSFHNWKSVSPNPFIHFSHPPPGPFPLVATSLFSYL